MVFRDEDWSRLKKIGGHHNLFALNAHIHIPAAEGNPDEEKIGAFGVGAYLGKIIQFTVILKSITGFYSLFSVTEEPFVTSGSVYSGCLARRCLTS